MKSTLSRVTAQSQISVPAEIRRRLGVGPGSVLEWTEENGQVIVRRAGRFSFEDLHRAAFPDQAPPAKALDEMKESIRHRARARYSRVKPDGG